MRFVWGLKEQQGEHNQDWKGLKGLFWRANNEPKPGKIDQTRYGIRKRNSRHGKSVCKETDLVGGGGLFNK